MFETIFNQAPNGYLLFVVVTLFKFDGLVQDCLDIFVYNLNLH